MKLLPKEYISDSIDSYLYKHTTKSQMIYWLVLLMLLSTIVALPFIYVDVTVQNPGLVRPINEKTELKSSITEIVDSVYVKEGDFVRKGELILRFRTEDLDAKLFFLKQKREDYAKQIRDLNQLTQGKIPELFHSTMIQEEFSHFSKKEKELQTLLQKSLNEETRNKHLFQKEVISVDEYENFHFALERAQNELSSLRGNLRSKWQADLNRLEIADNELYSGLKQLEKESERYTVFSPVNGTIEQFTGIYTGSSLFAGQKIAEISPDSLLYAEVYVSPRNIGYIKQGMPVNIQVESFNYNEWGTIVGIVSSISSDFYFDNASNTSYYKVKCSLEKDYLTLKNGTKGNLKKGMNVYVHFVLTRSSLFDLLYQKIDLLINPSQYGRQ